MTEDPTDRPAYEAPAIDERTEVGLPLVAVAPSTPSSAVFRPDPDTGE
jgi:hypothetical protein